MQILYGKRVDSGKRLVEQNKGRLQGQGARDFEAPAFAASNLPACLSARAKAWTFPKFTQGPKKFSYPFVFVGG